MHFIAKKSKIFFSSLAIIASLIGNISAFSTEIKMGILLPLTGTQAFYGKEAKNGIDLAIEELAKEKNNPIKYKFFVEDTQSTPVEAARGINKLITADRINVVIAEVISSNAIAAASITEDKKIPMLSPAATNDAVTIGKKYVFRTCFIDSFQGVVMANFAQNHLSAKTAVILEDADSDYSKGLSENFITTFEKSGGKIQKVLKYSQKDTSFTSQLADVRRLKPDILYIPGFHQQVGVILREAKDLQIKAKMLGGDGWYTPDLRNIANGAELGGFTSTHYSTDDISPKVKAFVSAYEKKYKTKPSAHAALGYDSFNMINTIAQKINSADPEKITQALSQLKNFNGITGNITMDKNHNPIKPAVILEYVTDGYKFITSIQPKK